MPSIRQCWHLLDSKVMASIIRRRRDYIGGVKHPAISEGDFNSDFNFDFTNDEYYGSINN